MRETVALVERDHKDVHRSPSEFETLRVVRFEEDWRANRPGGRFDDIEVDVSIGIEESSSDHHVAAS